MSDEGHPLAEVKLVHLGGNALGVDMRFGSKKLEDEKHVEIIDFVVKWAQPAIRVGAEAPVKEELPGVVQKSPGVVQ